jgi:hypothetical protein
MPLADDIDRDPAAALLVERITLFVGGIVSIACQRQITCLIRRQVIPLNSRRFKSDRCSGRTRTKSD